MILIEARNISFSFGCNNVLYNISLCVSKGGVVFLLGPNGSGKTTLLKILLGLYLPTAGEVLFEGIPATRILPKTLAKKVAYVPQIHRVTFAYSVIDVVLMGRTPHKTLFSRYSKADLDIALGSLDKLSILHLKDKPYTEISGGERQLTLIARALTQEARIFIMDEPVHGLDFGNQIRVLEHIAALSQDGLTFVNSTHFPDHAFWIADRVVMLKKGKIIQDGAPNGVITEENIYELYNTKVNLLQTADNLKVCTPMAVKNKKILATSL